MSRLKKLFLLAGLLLGARVASATDIGYTGPFYGTEGLATASGGTSSGTFTRDMNTTGDRVTLQVWWSSYTLAGAKSFTDGSLGTGQITVSLNSAVRITTPTISINGVNIAYTPGQSSTDTARSISDYIMATAALNSIVRSTWTSPGVVWSTSNAVGVTSNYAMAASSQSVLGVSGASFTGATSSSYTINTSTINIASHGYTTGLQVLYTTPSGQAITGLTAGTTYFISKLTNNSLELATTLANAQAANGINLTSSATKTTADTFTLTPLAITNTTGGGVQFQWSNSLSAAFVNVATGNYGAAITSTTFNTTTGSNIYDLGPIQYRYLRLLVTPPTTGAINYTVTSNERYSVPH